MADASVFLGLVADIMERLGPYLEPDAVDAETLDPPPRRGPADRAQDRHAAADRATPADAPASTSPRPGQNRGKTTVSLGRPRRLPAARPVDRVPEAGRPADGHRGRRPGRRGRRPDEAGLRPARAAPADEPGPHPARLHQGVHRGRGRRGPAGPDPGRPRARSPTATSCSSRAPATPGVGRGHRAVERRRRGAARRAGGHRLRGRRRPADRRDRAQRVALRAPRRARSPGAIVNKVDLDAQPGIARDPRARPRPPRHPAARRPAVPADPVEPDAGDGPRGRPRRDDPRRARTSTGSSAAIAIGAMEPRAHARADRPAHAWSSCRATART